MVATSSPAFISSFCGEEVLVDSDQQQQHAMMMMMEFLIGGGRDGHLPLVVAADCLQ
jgi:hypothetical protein